MYSWESTSIYLYGLAPNNSWCFTRHRANGWKPHLKICNKSQVRHTTSVPGLCLGRRVCVRKQCKLKRFIQHNTIQMKRLFPWYRALNNTIHINNKTQHTLCTCVCLCFVSTLIYCCFVFSFMYSVSPRVGASACFFLTNVYQLIAV